MMLGATGRSGAPALILGVGNILWADEGFGVRCVEQLCATAALSDGVEIMDGGTQGLALVNTLADAQRVLLFDAVDVGAAPASLHVVRGDDVPRFVAGKKVSLHQTSMMEVLALAEFMAGTPPQAITLIGCQPVELEDYGGGLTPLVAARVAEAVALGIAELATWGLPTTRRLRTTADDLGGLMPAAVAQEPYERDRPSAQTACRFGDERVLARTSAQPASAPPPAGPTGVPVAAAPQAAE